MSPERVANVVRWWVRLYTRHLPPHVAQRRIDELESDLHEHLVDERIAGRPDDRIAHGLASRALRGLAADLTWRRQELSYKATPKKESSAMPRRSAAIIASVTGAVLLVPAIGMAAGAGFDWGVFDFVLAAVLVAGAGTALQHLLRRPSALAIRLALAGAGGAAMILGEIDDAPTLVGFGLLLILVTVALTARTMRRSSARA